MMPKHKRGSIFLLLVTLTILGGLFFVLYLGVLDSKLKFKDVIGEKQLALLRTYQKGERALFYIDQAAAMSLSKSLYKIGEDGGVTDAIGCGEYFGYAVWNAHDKTCFPEDGAIREKILDDVDGELIRYLLLFPSEPLPDIPYSYSLSTDNNKVEILGNAKERLRMVIASGEHYNFALAHLGTFKGVEPLKPEELPKETPPPENQLGFNPKDCEVTAYPTTYKGLSTEPSWKMKQYFGSTKEIVEKNLVTVTIKGIPMKVHKCAADAFRRVARRVENIPYSLDPKWYGGDFYWREKRGGGGMSYHSFGIAVDLNTINNPFQKKFQTDMPKCFVDVWLEEGFEWGGNYWIDNPEGKKDPMHFEYVAWANIPNDAWQKGCKLEGVRYKYK